MQEKGSEEIVIPLRLTEELTKATVAAQPDKPVQNRSPSTRLFLHASGDWKVVLKKDAYWVVGHHLAYPARDRDEPRGSAKSSASGTNAPRFFHFIVRIL